MVVSTLDCIPEPGLGGEAFRPEDAEKAAAAAAVLREAQAEARTLDVDFHWALARQDAPGNECRENISRSFYVASDGSVSPCVYVNLPVGNSPDRVAFGNVNERHVLEIWNDGKFRGFRDRLAKGNPGPPCVNCVKRFMG